MAKNLIVALAFLTTFTSCGQTPKKEIVNGVTIEPAIKIEAERHFEDSKEFNAFKNIMQVYANTISVESFENDKLAFTSNDPTKKTVFKSFYYWHGDTLSIDGAYGLFGGTGFCINMNQEKAAVYHMLSSDDFPSYSYKTNDSLISRLEVPCTSTKIILSELPDSTKKQVIYGYVEFKSADFFSSNISAEEEETLQRTKHRDNMRIYFRSGYLDIENMRNGK